jgi:hypothetical protein
MVNRRHRRGAFFAINEWSNSDATALAGEEPLKSAPRCSISMQPMVALVRYMIQPLDTGAFGGGL